MSDPSDSSSAPDRAGEKTDEQLMAAFARGQTDAFDLLFERYKQPLFGFFRRRLDDTPQAEELAQETFLAVLRGTARYEATALFRTWLYAIGFKILRAYRRKAAFRAMFAGASPLHIEPAAREHLDKDLLMREAVGKLDRMDREILLLREFEQLTLCRNCNAAAIAGEHGALASFQSADRTAQPAVSAGAAFRRARIDPIGGTRMTTTAQHAAPEEIMALLDGEISAAEARTMTSHIEECTECAGVADQLRETSQSLAGWTVPAAPETLGKAIQGNSRKAPHAPRLTGFGFGNWRLWALGTGAAAAVILVIVVTAHSVSTAADRDIARRSPVYMAQQNEGAAGRLAMSAPPPSAARQGFIAGAEMDALQQPAQRLGTAGMINGSLRNSAALTALPIPRPL